MKERRREERLNELNEMNISVVSPEIDFPDEKTFHGCSEDISVSGTKICANILLPVGTLLGIKLQLKAWNRQITTLVKVRWSNAVVDNKLYETGLQFVDTSAEATDSLRCYVSWKQKFTSLNRPLWFFLK